MHCQCTGGCPNGSVISRASLSESDDVLLCTFQSKTERLRYEQARDT